MKTYVSYIVIYHLVMTNSSPWKDPPIFKFGKPSISMGHLYHGYVSHNQSPLRFHHSWAKRSRKRPASALVPRGAVPLWKNQKKRNFLGGFWSENDDKPWDFGGLYTLSQRQYTSSLWKLDYLSRGGGKQEVSISNTNVFVHDSSQTNTTVGGFKHSWIFFP